MIVGVSGHQKLDNYNVAWIRSEIIKLLNALPFTTGASSLAVGSDQLFANTIIEKSIPLRVVIPCKRYEETFTIHTDLINYKNLLNQASETIILDFNEPTEIAFYTAGKTIVENCDLLIAIWDGHQAKGLGGTGDIVAYANSLHLGIIHLNPSTEQIIYYNYVS